MGHEFLQTMLGRRHVIKNVPITTRNPQLNAICEQMHLTIGNILRKIMRTTKLTNVQQATQVADNALRPCNVHVCNTMCYTPSITNVTKCISIPTGHVCRRTNYG